jgi:hypothetical protein
MKINFTSLKSIPNKGRDGWWKYYDDKSIFFVDANHDACIFFDKLQNDITIEEMDECFFDDAERIENVKLTIEI